MDITSIFELSFWYALIIGIAVGSVSAYIGSLMLTNQMTLMAGALGHLTLPGIALALRYNFDVSIGALLFLIIGITLIWLLEKWTSLPFEALTAIIFTTSVAIAFLFLPEGKTEPLLLGDISQINVFICLITLITSCIIFLVIRHIFNRMIITALSKDLAQSNNINVSMYNFIYLLCIACIIALGIRIVGGLMTAALVAIPPSTGRNLSANLAQYVSVSIIAGALACVVGIGTSQVLKLPVGSMVILSSSLLFIISLAVRSLYKKS